MMIVWNIYLTNIGFSVTSKAPKVVVGSSGFSAGRVFLSEFIISLNYLFQLRCKCLMSFCSLS